LIKIFLLDIKGPKDLAKIRLVSKRWFSLSLDSLFGFRKIGRVKTKPWLNPLQEKDAYKIELLVDLQKKMEDLAPEFSHAYHTCRLEAFHSERLQLASKERNFWNTWITRS